MCFIVFFKSRKKRTTDFNIFGVQLKDVNPCFLIKSIKE